VEEALRVEEGLRVEVVDLKIEEVGLRVEEGLRAEEASGWRRASGWRWWASR